MLDVLTAVGRIALRTLLVLTGLVIAFLALTVETLVSLGRLIARSWRAAMRLGWDFFLICIPIIGWLILAHRGATHSRRKGIDRTFDKPLWPHWHIYPRWAR